MRAVLSVVGTAAGILLVTGCSAAPAGPVPSQRPPTELRAEVLEVLPHDHNAFTQGLELADGVLYEGTGLEGESELRATNPDTGEVHRATALPADLFGEGITVAGDTIWQLTWQDGIAIQRDRHTLAERGRTSYDGEGWGLCHDPATNRLIMSDGTDRLTFRDPRTFDRLDETQVRDAGEPVERLNELECVADQEGRVSVYANVWQTDEIVRIDPASGRVTATVDLAGLLPEADRAGADVLNGIAAIPGTNEFIVTGKLWPKMFRVRFVTANP